MVIVENHQYCFICQLHTLIREAKSCNIKFLGFQASSNQIISFQVGLISIRLQCLLRFTSH